MHVHSVDDPRALYEGGLGPPFPLGRRRVRHAPVEEAVAFWREANGCTDVRRPTTALEGEPGSISEGQSAQLLRWEECSSGRPVWLWRLTGAGHAWPGQEDPPLRELMGPPTTLLHMAEEAWAFFDYIRDR